MEAGEEGRDGVGINASATDKDEITVDTGQPQTPVDIAVDKALKILVCNATEEFGFAPHDVYNAVLDLPATREFHATAVKNPNYSKLKTLVKLFSDKRELDDFSHRVVAVHPVPFLAKLDRWVINFKSNRIGWKVVESMRLEEDKHLRETYGFLRRSPESSGLAGWMFEAIVHHMLSDGWRSADGPMPQPIRMAPDGCDPPTFSAPGIPLSSHTPLRACTRTVVRVDFTVGLSNVTLDNNRYYVPTATNNAFFDSFTIDLAWHAVVITVFLITTSPDDQGSAEGYHLIRDIILHVRKLLNEKEPHKTTVEVAYFLVCPKGESKSKWHMPVGWGKRFAHCDHRGDGFCLYVPVSVGHNAWDSILLNYICALFTRSLLFAHRNLFILSSYLLFPFDKM